MSLSSSSAISGTFWLTRRIPAVFQENYFDLFRHAQEMLVFFAQSTFF
jgi:hypothetical protein